MTCVSCTHWSPQQAKDMARHRMAPCALGPLWTYYGDSHICEKHKQAEEKVVAARVVWVNKVKRS